MTSHIDNSSPGELTVRPAQPGDLAQVATLHGQQFAGRFLGSLSPGLLKAYYACLLDTQARFLLAWHKDQLAGLALGGLSPQLARARQMFLRRHCLRLGWHILLRPRLWRQVYTRLVPSGPAPQGPPYRLLSLAVAPAKMGDGTAARLLAAFERGLPAPSYGCSVRADNPRALAFYLAQGFADLGQAGGSIYLAKRLERN